MSCECVVHTDIGRLRHPPGEQLQRHRHDLAFAAVVLSGTYVEAGDRGRMRVGAGDVVLHGAHESHSDQFDRVGAEVLVLPWLGPIATPLGSVRDPDHIARLAERDVFEGLKALERELTGRPVDILDWPDQLAADLRSDPGIALEEWASGFGLRPETVSRGFRRAYGVTPVAFRARARVLSAIRKLKSGSTLADVAADCNFSDQAHLTRSFRSMMDCSPSQWRQEKLVEEYAIRRSAQTSQTGEDRRYFLRECIGDRKPTKVIR